LQYCNKLSVIGSCLYEVYLPCKADGTATMDRQTDRKREQSLPVLHMMKQTDCGVVTIASMTFQGLHSAVFFLCYCGMLVKHGGPTCCGYI